MCDYYGYRGQQIPPSSVPCCLRRRPALTGLLSTAAGVSKQGQRKENKNLGT